MSTVSCKQSRCSVFGCKTEHKSLAEPLRTQWITSIFQGNAPQNLPIYVYLRKSFHSRLLCECHVVIVLSILTAFACVRYRSLLIDQCHACGISLRCAVRSVDNRSAWHELCNLAVSSLFQYIWLPLYTAEHWFSCSQSCCFYRMFIAVCLTTAGDTQDQYYNL